MLFQLNSLFEHRMAVKKCCIQNCHSCSTRKEDIGVTYHKYPKDIPLCDMWMSVTRHKHLNIASTSYVCSRHFCKSDFQVYKDSKYVLKSGIYRCLSVVVYFYLLFATYFSIYFMIYYAVKWNDWDIV